MVNLKEKVRIINEKIRKMHPEYTDGNFFLYVTPAVKNFAPMLKDYEWIMYCSQGEHLGAKKYGMIFITNMRWVFVKSGLIFTKPFIEEHCFEDIVDINFNTNWIFEAEVFIKLPFDRKEKYSFESIDILTEAIDYIKKQTE